MGLTFTKATKEQSKLRLALFGPSGSGKTFTSLRMATGLGGKIAVIDTERGSASKYADRFEFDVLELPAKDIATYCAGIQAAQDAGYNILIIDSLTHAWHELLSEVDKLAKAKYRGNTWSAWSEGTPKQRRLVDAILNFDGHVLVTMRTKTEWTTQKTSKGTTQPVRVGLAPEQGKGIEYEFDMLIELTVDHIGSVIKDRTGKYQDAVIEEPGERLGKELREWLGTGAVPERKDPTQYADYVPADWPDLKLQAVAYLGYNHENHVKNALQQIYPDGAAGVEVTAAWKALIDHQLSKDAKATETAKQELFEL